MRLSDFVGASVQAPKALEAIKNPDCGWFYRRDAETFRQIPGAPIAYWASDALLDAFATSSSLVDVAKPRQGLATGDNNSFLRDWWEVSFDKLGRGMSSAMLAKESGCTWFPCNKGGGYRRWYGFNSVVIDWKDDGRRLKEFPGSVVRNPSYYFSEGMSWGTISSAKMSMRWSPVGAISEHAGSMIYLSQEDDLFWVVLGLTNSVVAEQMMAFLFPSLRFTEGPVGLLPVAAVEDVSCLKELVETLISMSKIDYDTFETSWDFERHPLL